MARREDLFEESMQLGHSAAWDIQWNRAIEFYRKALAEFPEHPGGLVSLGLALYETKQFKEALVVYHKAAKIDSNDPIPTEKCAEIFERLGQIDDSIAQREETAKIYLIRKDAQKAIENWTHIARLKPAFLPARSRLALTYERTGRPQDAVHEYMAVASILQRGKKIDRAIEAVQRALRISPGDKVATKALRSLEKDRPLPAPKQPRGATASRPIDKVQDYVKPKIDVASVDEIELADPEVSAQHQALSIAASMLFDDLEGDEEKSDAPRITALTRGRSGGKKKAVGRPQMYRYLGNAIDLQTRGNEKQAIREYKRAIDAGLTHPAVHYNLGYLLKNLEDYDDARKHLLAALGHPELDLGANLALGRMAHKRDDLPEAARHLIQALKLADSLSIDMSQSAQLNRLYDSILASQAEADEDELENIVENTLKFLSGPNWFKTIKDARQQLESQRAEKTVGTIVGPLIHGADHRILQTMDRIDHLVAKKLYATAMEEAMLAIEYAPSYLGLYLRLAQILIESGETETGLEKLNVVARTYRVRGEIPQATEVYEEILRVAPINTPARSQLIELLALQDRNDEALEQYMELTEIFRQMAEIDAARTALANALRLAQNTPSSEEWSSKLLHQIGDIDLSRLDWRRALLVYEQIRTIDPSDEKARGNLIDLNLRLGQEDQAAKELDSYLKQLTQTDRGAEALNLIEELTREHPGKQTLHSRLAEAYRAAGRMADAIAQYDALGEILLDAGKNQDAISTIQTIIDLEPPDIEGYQELLKSLKGDL